MKSKQSRISHPFPLMVATASHFVIARKTVKNPFSIKIRSYEVQEKWEFRKYAVSSGSSLAPRQCFGMSHSPARRQNVSTASPLMGPPGEQELFCLLIFSREWSTRKALPILNKEPVQYINKISLREDSIIFLLLEEPQVVWDQEFSLCTLFFNTDSPHLHCHCAGNLSFESTGEIHLCAQDRIYLLAALLPFGKIPIC